MLFTVHNVYHGGVDKTLQSYIVLAGYSTYISLYASTSETLLTVFWSWYW